MLNNLHTHILYTYKETRIHIYYTHINIPEYKRNPRRREIVSGPKLEPVLPKQNRPKPEKREYKNFLRS